MNTVEYIDQLTVQMRKGTLTYAVLKACSGVPVYPNDVVKQLQLANMSVVEGTIYAILSRLQKDGLLQHEWKVSLQGPPRKYYSLTPEGKMALDALEPHIESLIASLTKLKGEKLS